MKTKKLITYKEYQNKMDKIINKKNSLEKTFILMLKEASKYKIKDIK
jgi:hypothetical protein